MRPNASGDITTLLPIDEISMKKKIALETKINYIFKEEFSLKQQLVWNSES